MTANPFAQALSAAVQYAVVSRQVSEQEYAVGFLYREAPVFEHDSGWRIFSGAEDDAYADDAANFDTVPLQKVLAQNPEIGSLMQHGAGAWEWDDTAADFVAVSDWQPHQAA